MKKYFILFLLILTSCKKDDIVEQPIPTVKYIFNYPVNVVENNQDLNFELFVQDLYTLYLTNGIDVISKETFTSNVGLNTKKLYTQSLPKGQYVLILSSGSDKVLETIIIVE